MGAPSTARRGRRAGIALLALALTAPCVPPAPARAAEQGAAPAPRHGTHPTRERRSALEQRVEMLAKALHLDERQQLEVRKVLQREREQVREVWNDTSVPAARRVAATQAIGDRTADQIRAVLNDEQKKSYKPPRQAHEPGSSRTVEEWMANRKGN